MKSAEEIRSMARNQLTGNYGTAIMITLLPPFIAAIITFITGLIFGNFPFINSAISSLITAVFAFMTYKMLVAFVKKERVDFADSLGPGHSVMQFVLYTFVFFLVATVVNIPLNLAMYGEAFPDIAASADYGTGSTELLMTTLLYSVIAWAIMFFITIRLYLVEFLITDSHFNMNAIQAMQESWKLTKGQVGRIIYLNLTFIGWFILIVITCGIAAFYVVPYYMTSIAILYLEILDENGKSKKRQREFDAALQGDWIDVEDTPEEKQEKQDDSWDF